MAARSEDLYLRRARVLELPRRTARSDEVPPAVFRRRRMAASTGVFLLIVSLFLLATGPEGSALASRAGAPKVVELQPGQGLWDLAERYSAPGQDPRAYVDALVEMNDLGPVPQIGERIRLPR